MPETIIERHTRYLRYAELQFLLAHKVNVMSVGSLCLDQPTWWTYGQHSMSREEMTLSNDDASLASAILHHSATLSLTVQIVATFKQVIGDVRDSADETPRSAFEIARLIRNAYTHRPMEPHWSIDEPCRETRFEVPGVIALDTTNLQGQRFKWQDYGGPIALYRLSEYVRTQILPHAASSIATGATLIALGAASS